MSKIYKFSILQVTLFWLNFVGIVSVGTVFVTSIISSRVMTESP